MTQKSKIPFILDRDHDIPSHLAFSPNFWWIVFLKKKNLGGSHQVHADRWAAKNYLRGHLRSDDDVGDLCRRRGGIGPIRYDQWQSGKVGKIQWYNEVWKGLKVASSGGFFKLLKKFECIQLAETSCNFNLGWVGPHLWLVTCMLVQVQDIWVCDRPGLCLGWQPQRADWLGRWQEGLIVTPLLKGRFELIGVCWCTLRVWWIMLYLKVELKNQIGVWPFARNLLKHRSTGHEQKKPEFFLKGRFGWR